MATDPDTTVDDDAYTEEELDDDVYEEDDSWWDLGLAGILLVAGVVLFLFPEPITSGIGVLLVVVGVIVWLADVLM